MRSLQAVFRDAPYFPYKLGDLPYFEAPFGEGLMPKTPPPGSRSHPTRCFFRQARLGYQKKDLEEAKAADGTDGPMAISPCSDPWDPWGSMGAMGA